MPVEKVEKIDHRAALRRGVWTLVVVAVLLSFLMFLSERDQNLHEVSGENSKRIERTQTPADERSFIQTVESFITEYQKVQNELQKSALRT